MHRHTGPVKVTSVVVNSKEDGFTIVNSMYERSKIDVTWVNSTDIMIMTVCTSTNMVAC